MGTESYKGKGTLYLRRKGSDEGLLPVGNCSQINIQFAESKQEQKDYEEAGGAVIDTHTTIDSVSAALTVLNLNAKNIARATGGSASIVPSSVIAAEAQLASQGGSFIPFDLVPDSSKTIAVTDAGASTTFVDGTDYEFRNGGILVIDGGAIAALGDAILSAADETARATAVTAAALEVSYTSLESYTIETLTLVGEEFEAYFDGLNEARSGKPVLLTGHRVKLNPTQNLPLISDDFASLDMSLDFLKDDSVTGTGRSKYIKMQMAS